MHSKKGEKDMLKVRNMYSKNSGREVPNQFVIETDGVVAFQSYRSTIATIDWQERTISIGSAWNYSTTTGKYRNAFFEEFCFDSLATKKGVESALEEGICFDGYNTWKVVLVNDYE